MYLTASAKTHNNVAAVRRLRLFVKPPAKQPCKWVSLFISFGLVPFYQRGVLLSCTIGSQVILFTFLFFLRVFESLMFSSFLLKGRKSSSMIAKLVANLAFIDASWTIKNILYWSLPPETQSINWLCSLNTMVYVGLILSSCFLVAFISYFSYKRLTSRQKQVQNFNTFLPWILTLLLSFLLSLVYVSLIDSKYRYVVEGSIYCEASPRAHVGLIVIPIAISFLFCGFFYGIIILKYLQQRKSASVRKSRTALAIPLPLRFTVYILIFLCCWAVELVRWVLILFRLQTEGERNWITTLGMVAPQYQGFANLLVYGVASNLLKYYSLIEGALLFLIGPFVMLPVSIIILFKKLKTCCDTSGGDRTERPSRPLASYDSQRASDAASVLTADDEWVYEESYSSAGSVVGEQLKTAGHQEEEVYVEEPAEFVVVKQNDEGDWVEEGTDSVSIVQTF